ncbi:MAG: RecB family exonuclease [Weeksellaceae bacterium]
MAADRYSAVWVSHSSINDYLKCPRAYYLKNIYKDPKTNHKIKIMSPPLALGQAVHEVIESLSVLPVEQRFTSELMSKFEACWEKVSGKKGGFLHIDIESRYKERGREMINRVSKNPGPLVKKAVKIKKELPYYWLSEEDNIILCGKIDWLEYMEEIDSVHIIDFKTSNRDEEASSLQLPIYYLLVSNTQTRPVAKMSYWYIARDEHLSEKPLPDQYAAHQRVLEIAKEIKLARTLDRFPCPEGGCMYCKQMEAAIRGEAEFVYVDAYNTDVYIFTEPELEEENGSEIL